MLANPITQLFEASGRSRRCCKDAFFKSRNNIDQSLNLLIDNKPLINDKELNLVLPNISLNTASQGKIYLTNSQIDATVTNGLANVNMSFEFVNDSPQAVESVVKFSCESSIVSGFNVTLNGVTKTAQVKEKEEAKADYDDNISSGHTVYMAEVKRDALSISLGNIKATKRVTLGIQYIIELNREGNIHTLTLPVMSCKATNSSTHVSTITFDMESDIKSLRPYGNPSIYNIDIQKNKATVTLKESDENKFIELEVELADPDAPTNTIEQYDEENTEKPDALMLTFTPNTDDVYAEFASEIICIVDRSGSMSGSRIRQAQNALQLLLRAIPEGTYFNIIGFGSQFKPLFPQSVLYDNQSLKTATDFVSRLDASMGGTDIYSPLNSVLEMVSINSLPRQIFLLTDGEDSNEHKIFSTIKKKLGDSTRIFTFGIGHESSQSLVKGISKFGNGKYEFISSGEGNTEESVMSILNESLKPVITGLTLDWGEVELETRPISHQFPPLFNGRTLAVYEFLSKTKENTGKKVVTLNGNVGDEKVSFTCEVDFSKKIKGSNIHKCAAHSIASDLAKAGKEMPTAKETITELGLTYGIVTKHTNLFLVQENLGEQAEELVFVDLAENTEKGSSPMSFTGPPMNSLLRTGISQSRSRSFGPMLSRLSTRNSMSVSSSDSDELEECDFDDEYDSFGSIPSYSSAPPLDGLIVSSMADSCGPSYELPRKSMVCEERKKKEKKRVPKSSLSKNSIELSKPTLPPQSFSNKSQLLPSAPPKPQKYASKKKESSLSSPTPVNSSSVVVNLLSLSDSSGLFALTEALANILKTDVNSIKAAVPKELESSLNVWASLLALAFLKINHANESNQWSLASKKTTRAIMKELKSLSYNFKDGESAAENYVKLN